MKRRREKEREREREKERDAINRKAVAVMQSSPQLKQLK